MSGAEASGPRGLVSTMLTPVRLDQPTGHSIWHRTALGTIGVGVQGLLRFLVSLFVGHIGGPSVLGVVQSAVSTALLLALLWPTTTGSAASKFIARARGAGDHGEVRSVGAHLSKRTRQAAILLAAASIPIWIAVDGGDVGGGLCVAALLLGYAGYSFTRGLQFGAGQIPRATMWDLTSAGLGLVGVLIALVLGARGATLLLPLALSYGIYAFAGWPWGAHGRPSPDLRREMDGFVAIGVAGTIASTGLLQLSVIVARLIDTKANVGQYSAAFNLATPASLLAGALSLALFPSMAEAWGRGDRAGFRAQTDQATRALVVTMVTMLGGIAVASRFIVAVIWGTRYSAAADLLPILVAAVLATTLGVASVNALSTRSQRGMAIASASSLAGLLTGGTVWLLIALRDDPTGAAWAHGVRGIAVGYLCGTVLIGGIPIVVVWVTDRQRWGWLMTRLACGVAAAAVLVWAQRALDISHWLDPAAVAVFLAFWWVLSHRDLRAALGVIRRR